MAGDAAYPMGLVIMAPATDADADATGLALGPGLGFCPSGVGDAAWPIGLAMTKLATGLPVTSGRLW